MPYTVLYMHSEAPAIGTAVTYTDGITAGTYTVTGHEDCGLRVTLEDADGTALGWAVMTYDVTVIDEAAGRKAASLTTFGQTIAMQIDSTVITVQYVRHGAYTVTVYDGSYRVTDLCTSHPSEGEARDVARGIARSFVNDIFRLAA